MVCLRECLPSVGPATGWIATCHSSAACREGSPPCVLAVLVLNRSFAGVFWCSSRPYSSFRSAAAPQAVPCVRQITRNEIFALRTIVLVPTGRLLRGVSR